MYLVDDMYEPIISEEVHKKALEIMKNRAENMPNKNPEITAVSGFIKCGHCGAWYVPKTWHANDKYRKKIYICNDKYKVKGKPCKSPHFTEDEIKDMFIRALNKLTKVKKTVNKEMNSLIGDMCSTTDLEIEASKLEREIQDIVSEMNSLIKVNANTAQNQEEYLKRENQIRLKYQEAIDRLTDINNKIELKQNQKTILLNFIKTLDGVDVEFTEFDEDLWSGLLDYILIKDKGKYTVVFKNGTEIDI